LEWSQPRDALRLLSSRSLLPTLPKEKTLELARGEWIEQHCNCYLLGNAGTGKTCLATALGLAACRLVKRSRFFAAADLVKQLEEALQQHRLDCFLAQIDRTDLLVCDDLGYRTSVMIPLSSA
jgi:DNA replication protein DnaC